MVMKIIYYDLDDIIFPLNNCALCLGFFDGVHIGHQKMIEKALNENKNVAVLTFDKSPLSLLSSDNDARLLTTVMAKGDILNKIGVKYLIVIRMSYALLNLQPIEFVNTVLKKLNPIKLYVGNDYHFGKSAKGDATFLKHYFDVRVVNTFTYKNNKISSSQIKKLIGEGNIKEANSLLGRFYCISGNVVKGLGNGHRLGFPTANIDVPRNITIPKEGTYIGYCIIDNYQYKCVFSVGTHPTIDKLNSPSIEAHIINCVDNLYGKKIDVLVVDYLRDNKKFRSLSALKEQIALDKNYAIHNL